MEPTRDGFTLDPSAYLAQLPTLAGLLPTGAQAFATDALHYDFWSQRCIKNLKPQRLISGEDHGLGWLELRLRHNCWRHEEDLTIRYHGVRRLTLGPARIDREVSELQDLLLDEILPHEHGCSHEIACLDGSMLVVCRDLTATWVEADCPERHLRS